MPLAYPLKQVWPSRLLGLQWDGWTWRFLRCLLGLLTIIFVQRLGLFLSVLISSASSCWPAPLHACSLFQICPFCFLLLPSLIENHTKIGQHHPAIASILCCLEIYSTKISLVIAYTWPSIKSQGINTLHSILFATVLQEWPLLQFPIGSSFPHETSSLVTSLSEFSIRIAPIVPLMAF